MKDETIKAASENPPGKKKRRRRGRGKPKGELGSGAVLPTIPELKKLAGLTDRERSKFAAILNEILGLILPS